jgi:hypothetical protein
MIKLFISRPTPDPSDYPPPNPPFKAVNKSVRDFPMRGTRKGDVITIVMRKQKYLLNIVEFVGKTKWDQMQVLNKMFAHWDDEPGGPGQATRLREGFADIIRQLTPPKPSLQDLVDANKHTSTLPP